MKTKYINQIDKNTLLNIEFDFVIAATGYESRASYIASLLNDDLKCDKIVIGFPDYKYENSRIENDRFFNKRKYKFIECDGAKSKEILTSIDNFILSCTKDDLSILVDYSSMTRNWYGAIINHFKLLYTSKKSIRVFYSYSAAEFYSAPEKESIISNFNPIPGYCNLSIPSCPTALITALGYDKNKAFGLREYFDAEVLYLFYTEGNKFSEIVKDRNEDIIKSTKPDFIFPFNMKDLLYTKSILYDLCVKISANYRIIIAPCGPKPFTLLSFLISSSIDLVDVWRISGIDYQANRKPNGEVFTIEMFYE